MAKVFMWVVIIVFVVVVLLSVLTIFKILPTLMWMGVVIPLITFLVGYIIAFAIGASGLLKEELTRDVIKVGIGAISGITISNITSWWESINQFLNDSEPEVGVFVLGASLFTLLLGLVVGIYIGLQMKPAVQKTGGANIQNLTRNILRIP
jgi:hypothetical protein